MIPKHGEFWWCVIKRPVCDLYTIGLVQKVGDDLAIMVIGQKDVFYFEDGDVEMIRRVPTPRDLSRKIKNG